MHGNEDARLSPGSQDSSSKLIHANAAADRNLLFGIIALQVNFISRESLVAAFDAWTQDKARSLSEILVSQKSLSPEEREILDRLVGRFLIKHGDNAEKSLAALSAASSVRLDLGQLNDCDLAASLGHLVSSGSIDSALVPTLTDTGSGSGSRFQILRPHAKGGLGQVSVALDRELHREVALKEIQPQLADDRICRERFVQEAEITGGLEHPGIVPVYALGHSPDGRPFYAMRFVKGDSLKQAIDTFHKVDNPNRKELGARHLALRQLLGRFIDVCNAIEYAHSRGVLHRDLKPGNIMVGKYGETLVVDWGLAKSVGRVEKHLDEPTLRPLSALSSSGQTRPGSAIGTPAYMSPEQAAGRLEELGVPSDVYSLGATLFHLLCGKPPFDKKDIGEILQRVQRGDFPRPHSVEPSVPTPLEAICLKAMALRPVDRYQSAHLLAIDIEHWLADEPVVAMADTLAERFSRFGRKHRGYVRAGTIAMILIALVSSLAAVQINFARKAALELADKNDQLAKRNLLLAERAQESAEEKETERQRAEASEKKAIEKTLEAYEGLAQAAIAQSGALQTANQIGRQSTAFAILEQAGSLHRKSIELVESLEHNEQNPPARAAGSWGQGNRI